MFRPIVSIVTSAVLLGLSVASCLKVNLREAEPSDWLMFSIYAIIGLVALVRLIVLAKELDRHIKDKRNKPDATE